MTICDNLPLNFSEILRKIIWNTKKNSFKIHQKVHQTFLRSSFLVLNQRFLASEGSTHPCRGCGPAWPWPAPWPRRRGSPRAAGAARRRLRGPKGAAEPRRNKIEMVTFWNLHPGATLLPNDPVERLAEIYCIHHQRFGHFVFENNHRFCSSQSDRCWSSDLPSKNLKLPKRWCQILKPAFSLARKLNGIFSSWACSHGRRKRNPRGGKRLNCKEANEYWIEFSSKLWEARSRLYRRRF